LVWRMGEKCQKLSRIILISERHPYITLKIK
jgi:hypothetical protein